MVIGVVLSLALCPALSADTGSAPAAVPDVVALIAPLDPEGEDFHTVIASALSLRLTPMGLSLDIQTVPTSDGEQAKNDPLVEQAKKTGAAAILTFRYSVAKAEMAATMDWYDVQQGTHASVSEKKARVDLELDTFILEVIDSLISQVQDQTDQIAAKRKAADTAAATAAAAAASREAQTATAAPKVASAPVIARPTIEPAEDATPRRFLVSTGLAPFIPVGTASSYFTLGYLSSIMGGFFLTIPSGQIGLGLSLGVISFAAQGTLGSATSFLLPVGLDARYVLGGGSVVGLLLHVTGGAAALFVSSQTLGTLAKTLPFLRGGIGLELLFSKMVGVVLDAGYEVYFAMPGLIMGISPALNVSLRL